MEPLLLEPTEDTPEVILDSEKNTYRIANRSLPENAFDFYKPIYEWLEKEVFTVEANIEFHFQLDYFNTASAKQIGKIFNLLEQVKNKLVVVWHYYSDDLDMYESGKRFARLTGIAFDFIEEEPEQDEDDDFKIIYE